MNGSSALTNKSPLGSVLNGSNGVKKSLSTTTLATSGQKEANKPKAPSKLSVVAPTSSNKLVIAFKFML